MNREQLLYIQELRAVVFCEQSDGYLKGWADGKIKDIEERTQKTSRGFLGHLRDPKLN